MFDRMRSSALFRFAVTFAKSVVISDSPVDQSDISAVVSSVIELVFRFSLKEYPLPNPAALLFFFVSDGIVKLPDVPFGASRNNMPKRLVANILLLALSYIE